MNAYDWARIRLWIWIQITVGLGVTFHQNLVEYTWNRTHSFPTTTQSIEDEIESFWPFRMHTTARCTDLKTTEDFGNGIHNLLMKQFCLWILLSRSLQISTFKTSSITFIYRMLRATVLVTKSAYGHHRDSRTRERRLLAGTLYCTRFNKNRVDDLSQPHPTPPYLPICLIWISLSPITLTNPLKDTPRIQTLTSRILHRLIPHPLRRRPQSQLRTRITRHLIRKINTPAAASSIANPPLYPRLATLSACTPGTGLFFNVTQDWPDEALIMSVSLLGSYAHFDA